MEVGMFTMSEIEELFVLQDEYELNGCTYLFYAHWNHGFTDCRKLVVNITDKGMYIRRNTHHYIH